MAIEFKKPITFTKESTIYGHNATDEGGFPSEPGNGKLSQVLDMAERQTMDKLLSGITFLVDTEDSLKYHFCIDGTSVATFSVPPDKFLKSVSYDEDTKELVFTFTSGDSESSVRVNMSSLVDVYTAGDGLSLSSGVFSIRIKNTEERLKVDLDGIYIDLSDIIAKIDTETAQRQATYTDLDSRITALNLTFTSMTDEISADLASAKQAKTDAENAATLAQGYQTTASEKATSASNSALRAATSEANAKSSEDNAKASEANAEDYMSLAKDWAMKTDDTVDGEEYSAKYHAHNAKTSEDNAKAAESQAKSYLDDMAPGQYMKKSADSNLEMNSYNISFGAKSLIDFIWVVGEERYFTDASFDPNTYYAAIKGSAVWEKQTDGRFRVASGSGTDSASNSWTFSNGDMGGRKNQKLSSSNIPTLSISMDSAGAHTHDRGNMEITGEIGVQGCDAYMNVTSGAFYTIAKGRVDGKESNSSNYLNKAGFKASNSWTGSTGSAGSHSHTAKYKNDSPSSFDMLPPYKAITIWMRVS